MRVGASRPVNSSILATLIAICWRPTRFHSAEHGVRGKQRALSRAPRAGEVKEERASERKKSARMRAAQQHARERGLQERQCSVERKRGRERANPWTGARKRARGSEGAKCNEAVRAHGHDKRDDNHTHHTRINAKAASKQKDNKRIHQQAP